MEIQKNSNENHPSENDVVGVDHDEQAILAKKSKKITKWSLRAVFPIHKRVTVIIEGILLPDGIPWKTSPVQKVVDKRMIYTVSCSVYELDGEMNVKQSMENGFSDMFVTYLKDGFPEQWEYVLYNRIESLKTEESTLLQAKIKEIQEHKKNKQQPSNLPFSSTQPKVNQTNLISTDDITTQPSYNYPIQSINYPEHYDINSLNPFPAVNPIQNDDPSFLYMNNDLTDFNQLSSNHFLQHDHFNSPYPYHDLSLNGEHLQDRLEFQQKGFPQPTQHFGEFFPNPDISNFDLQPASISLLPNQSIPLPNQQDLSSAEPGFPVQKPKKRGRKPGTHNTAVRRSQRQAKKTTADETAAGRPQTRKRGRKRTTHQAVESAPRRRGRPRTKENEDDDKEDSYSIDSERKETEGRGRKRNTTVTRLAKKGSLKRREQLRQLIAENDEFLASKMQEENPKQLFEDSSTVFPIDSILNINEPKITSYSHKEPIESSYSISEADDDTNFESINARELDRIIVDEQRVINRRKPSKQLVSKVSSKKQINVIEDNDRSIIRASMTPNGESRIEIKDKDEGILHFSENEGNDTDDNDL